MKYVSLITLSLVAGLGLFACGSDDSDGSDGAGGSDNAGGSSGSGGTAGGSAGGAGGSSPSSGEFVPAGHCFMGEYRCTFVECDTSKAQPEEVKAGAKQICADNLGVWTDTEKCPTAGSIGSCRESRSYGYMTTSFYEGGGMAADSAKSTCDANQGTWTVP